MTLPSVENAEYPNPDEVLAQLLTDIKYAYDRIGVTANVAKGSELYERMKVIAGRISIAINNNRLSLADISPLDATGDALIELAKTYGVTKRPAASAQGLVQVFLPVAVQPITIPKDYICTSPTGIQYKTTSSNVVNREDYIQVIAVSGGADTDAEVGDVLTWDSAAIGYLEQTCIVGPGGIEGGADEDDEETLRSRFLRRLRSPSVGGNTAQVVEWAETASASVDQAFCYMAVRGPSTYDVAIVRNEEDRALNDTIVNTVANYILARMPGSAKLNATSVYEEQLDVTIDMSLPLPVNAGGAGGGWRDAAPWPSDADSVLATVTDIPTAYGGTLAANTIEVDSTSADPPVVGKRFGIWDYGNEEMKEFTIKTVGGGTGAYLIGVDTGQSNALSFIEIGMRCSAGAVNLKAYASEFHQAMLLLGPGEKTSNVDKLPQGRRYPPPDVEAPSALTSLQLTAVQNSHAEVSDMVYAARLETGTANARYTPSIPATEADEPRILTLKHLSFRKM